MKRLEALTQVDWFISPLKAPWENKKFTGCSRVDHFIPDLFEAYGKIFHRIHIDEIEEEESKDKIHDPYKRLGETETDKIINKHLKQNTIIFSRTGAHQSEKGKVIKWKELFKEYDFPFSKEADMDAFARHLHSLKGGWPDYLAGPCQGSFDFEEFNNVLEILSEFSSSKLFYGFYEFMVSGYLVPPFEPTFKDELFLFKSKDLKNLKKLNPDAYSPSFLWPEDKSWLLHTDYDCDFSFIGGTEKLINSLVFSNSIECFEVQPGTRPFT